MSEQEQVQTAEEWWNSLLAEAMLARMDVIEDVALLSEEDELQSVRVRMAKRYRQLVGVPPWHRREFREALAIITEEGSMSPKEAAVRINAISRPTGVQRSGGAGKESPGQ